MNRYQPSNPRALIGLAASALSALTIVAAVMLPAKMGSPANTAAGIVASSHGPAALPAIAPDPRIRVQIVGVRERDVSAAEAKGSKAARDWQG